MKTFENTLISVRDPVSHHSTWIVSYLVDKKKTRDWEEKCGLIMRKNVYLVWSKRLIGEGEFPIRVCKKDFIALQKEGIV